MCLQCIVEAEIILEDPILGYFLMVATNDHSKEWPKGHYGLVKHSDPDFVWEGKPIIDPIENMSDEEVEALDYKTAEEWRGWERFQDFVSKIRPAFDTDPLTGYEFVNACKASGYNQKQDGDVLMWFIHHVAKKMEEMSSTDPRLQVGLGLSFGRRP